VSRWIKVESEYTCPLCPDHKDDVFIWNEILHAPICQGCNYELWNDIFGHNIRPESMLLDRLENMTVQSYEEYSLIEVESVVSDLLEHDPVDQDALKEYLAEVCRLKSCIKARENK
jgi:hypothetical protein